MQDFARLAPQVSSKVGLAIGGLSGAGANVRVNNFLIDGAPARVVPGNSSTPSLPIEAVKEVQILVAPYDVRFGDFSGVLVNAVSRTGTNAFSLTGFAYSRNDGLGRRSRELPPYDRGQFGFVFSGPILRNRLHFIVAPELQTVSSPARGPYIGQPADAVPALPVSPTDVARFTEIMRSYGLDPGNAGPASNTLRIANLFGRLDLSLPALHSRVAVLHSYSSTDNESLSRADTFALSSYRSTLANDTRLTSLQLHSSLPGGIHNSLALSLRTGRTNFVPDVQSPLVQVAVPSSAGSHVLKAGSQEGSQAVFSASSDLVVSETLLIPLAQGHDVTVGGQIEVLALHRGGVAGAYGTWTFPNLDAFETGTASRYQLRVDFGSAGLSLRALQYAAFAGDTWRVSDRLTIMAGVRGDAFQIRSRAPYNPLVEERFGRRTDEMPPPAWDVSPRVSVTWDPARDNAGRIRAGIGLFTGRYPAAWAHAAIYSNGSGTGQLRCGFLPSDFGPPPAFTADYRAAPRSCANGQGVTSAPLGDVNLLAGKLRMARSLRSSIAYDLDLPGRATATVEAMWTHSLRDFHFANLNLSGPVGADRHGRTMYGSILPNGVSHPGLLSDFAEVIETQNTSNNHSFVATARIDKAFSQGLLLASYTYSRVRDAGLPIRSGMRGTVNWSTQRTVSGSHADLSTGISLYDVPHRTVLAGVLNVPTGKLRTQLSFLWIGESGAPFTYVTGGSDGRGDLNADGALGNDPIYVPTDAADTLQIRFSGISTVAGEGNSASAVARRVHIQQQGLQARIAAMQCLRNQRGSIMARNSCREPWSHTTIASLRGTLPLRNGHSVALHVDVFNVLNLLHRKWGLHRIANVTLLSQSGSTALGEPVFVFDPSKERWQVLATESSYQLQFAIRYSFWPTQ
jgi:hypothetical protein